MPRRLARSAFTALLFTGSLVVAPGIANASASPTGAKETLQGVHRGEGWYDATVRIPEPPLALALVLIGAAGMRLRDHRVRLRIRSKRRLATAHTTVSQLIAEP
ncbi:MAG TPA: hypothetical protein ENK31_05040 [Nannocystis exedens]|nr:hypothetical protein [Nannocystis exedens]